MLLVEFHLGGLKRVRVDVGAVFQRQFFRNHHASKGQAGGKSAVPAIGFGKNSTVEIDDG
jgi:hypothetical protein